MNEILWYVSRGTGIASIVLLTAVLGLGVVTSGRRAPRGDLATVVVGLHRWLSLGMLIFLMGHIATAVVETYVSIDWVSALVPFTSGYEALWVGLGTFALDILLAVSLTSWLRHRMAETTWRWVHRLSYLMWPVAIVHGVALGTSSEPLLRGTTILCAAAGVGLVAWRLTSTYADRDRRATVAAQEWS